ncbi:MAG: transposase [Candidatus Peribacter sp.]|nr:transposase [Candidatus Peribacter sp.]
MPPQHSRQYGTFHITTNTREKVAWCTLRGIPELLIDNLLMTRNIQNARVHAFCILPDHMHIIMSPGKQGLSAFMHSFKRNSSWHIRQCFSLAAGVHEPRLPDETKTILTLKTGDIHWQNGFHDERIRDAVQRSNALTYVQYNAWRHGLTADPEGWLWSSLRFPDLIDLTEVWLD